MKKGMRIINTLFSAIAFVAFIPASSLTSDISVTGIYSSFKHSSKSGDIVGMEIHIVPNPVGYSAIIQGSEGAPAFPEVVRLKVSNRLIEFVIPKKSACGLLPGNYTGSINSDGLNLKGPAPNYREYYLPRGRSFWQ